jgi:thioredoxin reductase (NADPH)
VARALLIVGAGPAGVSAALWARSLDLAPTVIESAPTPGGQLRHIHFHPADLAGVASGDGPAIAASFARQLEAARVPVRCDAVAVGLIPARVESVQPAVLTSAGERLVADAVLIAAGVRRRHLEIPGELELEGRGVSFSATRDRVRFARQHVVVAGGGDAAFENALLLAAVGCTVTIAVRGTPRARPEFRARVAAEPRIEVRDGSRVVAALGEEQLRAVRLEGPRGAEELPAAGLVVKVGVIPNSEWCRSAIEHDPDGFLIVDARFATSQPRVWAAGDVTRPALPAIAVAMGQGALAAADIRRVLGAG